MEKLVVVSNSDRANLSAVSGSRVKKAPSYVASLDRNSQRLSVDLCEMGVGPGAIRDGLEKADYILTLNDPENLQEIRGFACLILGDVVLQVEAICAEKGAGRGSRLMKVAEDIARAHGISRVTLESVEESVGFYETIGYTSSGEYKDDLYPMEKTLTSGSARRRLRLKTLRKSHKKEKKWDAVFEKPDGSTKIVPFGQKGYSDYTKHKDKTRRQRYIDRHSGMGENWRDPATPGALSRYILWNKPTLKGSLRDFKKRFGV